MFARPPLLACLPTAPHQPALILFISILKLHIQMCVKGSHMAAPPPCRRFPPLPARRKVWLAGRNLCLWLAAEVVLVFYCAGWLDATYDRSLPRPRRCGRRTSDQWGPRQIGHHQGMLGPMHCSALNAFAGCGEHMVQYCSRVTICCLSLTFKPQTSPAHRVTP